MTLLNNFHRELFAVRCLTLVAFMLLTLFAALQSKTKEPHCGLFSGEVTNVATPSSFLQLCGLISLDSLQCEYCSGM